MTPTPDTLKAAIEYFTLPMYEGGPSNLAFLEGVEDRDDYYDNDIDPRTKGNSSRHIDALIKAATSAINLQERLETSAKIQTSIAMDRTNLRERVKALEVALDSAEKALKWYASPARYNSGYESLRDTAEEALANLAAVRKKL